MVDKLKSSLPYLGTILLFIIISFVYFWPVTQNKDLPQLDQTHAIGMAQELNQYQKQTGENAQWTNSMFGGMPAYQIKGDSSSNIFSYINRISRLALPYKTVAILFLYLIGFYIFLLSLKIDKWMSLIGAIAFAFGSYNLIIIIAGHITKAYTIALMGPVIAGILYTYNRDKWIGGVFTTIALGLQIAYNHVQISYYLAILVLIIVISRFIFAILKHTLPSFFKASGILAIAALLAILPNITNLWTTFEYGKYSIRGKSDLQVKDGQKEHSGLDKDYALAWSLEPKGTWSLLIPNVVGGASEAIENNPSALEKVDSRFRQNIGKMSQYWGGRPFTSGPVYAGAIICFLFMLGIFFYKGPDKWWLIAATIFSFMLAWGKHISWFTDIMFYHFPLYNKFRTVEMAMVIASFTIPTLGLLGLREIFKKPELIKNNTNKFLAAFGLTGGISLIFYLFPQTFFSFLDANDFAQKNQLLHTYANQGAQIEELFNNLVIARESLLKADALRSFIFIAIGSASLWFYATGKLTGKYLLWGLGFLIIIDAWSVDKRYLNNSDFVPARKAKSPFTETPADKAIFASETTGDRVFTIYQNPFNEVNTSYFHQSIGGFHGAKLRRYQDIIDRYLMNDWQSMIKQLQSKSSDQQIQDALKSMPALNMLNGRFVVYNPNVNPIINTNTYGNAWFVKEVYPVENPDGAIDAIGYTNLQKKAIVNIKEFASLANYHVDSIEGSIKLTDYKPDRLTYSYESPNEQLAVFSQIYYPKGWNAYIDGKPTDIYRANYILRALKLPGGKHKVEFKFQPKSYKIGKTIATISSILIVLLILAAGYKIYKKEF